MIIPNRLNKGDKIALIATARHISKNELDPAIKIIDSWGLKIKFGKNIFKIKNQFAGDDFQRASDLQDALDDESIKAIFCVRGGYGSARIIDLIDFSKFLKKPKWVIGYSDITVLHNHINNIGVASIHASMPINFKENSNDSLDSLYNSLFNLNCKISFRSTDLNRIGSVKGEVVGGNLSVIYSLLGSSSDIKTSEKILFIEDLDEYLYHIDRMLTNLKRNQKFSSIKALIVGGMTKMHDNTIPFGMNANQIIYEKTKEYDFPICFNFPSGHLKDNRSIIFGKSTQINIGKKIVEFIQ